MQPASFSLRDPVEFTLAIAGLRTAAADIGLEQASQVLAVTERRLSNYAEAHRALQSPAANECDLSNYLGRLCAAITAATLDERGVQLTLATPSNVDLAADRCWRVALIVSELITNAVRHGLGGKTGRVRVEVERGGGLIACRVSDDGKLSPTAVPGRGLAVVHALAAELGGTMNWRCSASGTTAELVFPTTNLGDAA